jgi:hypothetical protein
MTIWSTWLKSGSNWHKQQSMQLPNLPKRDLGVHFKN